LPKVATGEKGHENLKHNWPLPLRSFLAFLGGLAHRKGSRASVFQVVSGWFFGANEVPTDRRLSPR
jgi:hypothetical protein